MKFYPCSEHQMVLFFTLIISFQMYFQQNLTHPNVTLHLHVSNLVIGAIAYMSNQE